MKIKPVLKGWPRSTHWSALFLVSAFVAATLPAALAQATDGSDEEKQYYWLGVQEVKWRAQTYQDAEEGASLEDVAKTMVKKYRNEKPSVWKQANSWKPVEVSNDKEAKILWVRYVSLKIELAEPVVGYEQGNAKDRQEYLERYKKWKAAHPTWNIGPVYDN